MDRALGQLSDAFDSDARIWATKAQTLLRLAPLLRASRVPESLRFEYAQWCHWRSQLLAQIQLRFGHAALAVRSSRHDEDQLAQSQAGRYRSVLNVPAHAIDALSAAVEAVFKSYGVCAAHDEVLLQPMVANSRACYVASTYTLDTGAPYYVLEFASGPSTDIVTRGLSTTTTLYLARDAKLGAVDPDTRRILRALREIERLCGRQPLETEFVFAREGLFLLQARPIAAGAGSQSSRATSQARRAVRQRLARRERAKPGVCGESSLYGLMPDWNPAELLGSHPRPLALSLFRHLITRSTWRRARARLGYRELASGELLVELGGRPYVDVRLSLNSFLPAGLDASIGGRLVDAWLRRLRAFPVLHDKVEFEVASTCIDLDFDARHQASYPTVLTTEELSHYRNRLRFPTRNCLDRRRLGAVQKRLQLLYQSLSELKSREPSPATGASVAHLQHSLGRARTQAGLPYAQIARMAFVAEALLRSARRCCVLSESRWDALRAAIIGVTGQFLTAPEVGDATHPSDDLRARFGHLRAGTFEITVPCYALQDAAFLSPFRRSAGPVANFELAASERATLNQLLEKSDIGIDADELIAFYFEVTRAREYGKFVFAQAVSALLEDIAAWGRRSGLDRDVLAWLDIDDIVRHGDASAHRYRSIAEMAQGRHDRARRLKLPTLLDAHDPLTVVRCAPGAPNFQGRGVIEARIIEVNQYTQPAAVPMHCILAIESADPGFDWIFARRPAGLLTAYGGPNSHMAIRCAELDCPAVLGQGVESMRRVLRSARAVIDFDSGTVCGTRCE